MRVEKSSFHAENVDTTNFQLQTSIKSHAVDDPIILTVNNDHISNPNFHLYIQL